MMIPRLFVAPASGRLSRGRPARGAAETAALLFYSFLPRFLLRFPPMSNLDFVTVGVGDVDFAAGHIFGIVYRWNFHSVGQQVFAQAGQVGRVHVERECLR